MEFRSFVTACAFVFQLCLSVVLQWLVVKLEAVGWGVQVKDWLSIQIVLLLQGNCHLVK